MSHGDHPLRITFVMLHTSPLDEPGTKDAGGMNVVVRAQATELARMGHEVQLVTRRSDPEVDAVIELAPGLTVHHLDAGPPRLLAKGEHEALIPEFGAALATHLESFPTDLLHGEHWFSGIAALPVARAAGVPFVQSFHSIAAPVDAALTEGERPESPGRLEGEQRLAKQADRLIAVSQAEARTMQDRLSADPSRVAIVPLGVDTRLFRPCEGEECEERKAWIRGGGRPEIVVAGRLHPLKGFDLAVRAIASIAPESRPALRVVGAPPPDGDGYVREIHELIMNAGMLATVSFDGPLRRRELAERLRRASIVLVPSHSETFGLVALEASSSSIPVIARAAGGLREAVVDGETGVLIDSGDPEVWAREISRLLADTERADQLGKQGRRHALRRNWAASARALLAEYRTIVGSGLS